MKKQTGAMQPDWKKEMKKMKLDYLKISAPGFFELSGSYTMTVKPYTDQTANGLTKSICDYITFSGGSATRVSSTGMMRRINGEMKWTHGNTRKGTADIHAIYQGRHLSIEIKIGADTMSNHQHKEQERITRAGGLYFIARNMPDFIEWFTTQIQGFAGVQVDCTLSK